VHRAWFARQRLEDPLSQVALEQMLTHLDGIERHLDALDTQLQQIATDERWTGHVDVLVRFRGISTLTALGLIAEIGDSLASATRASWRRGSGSPRASTQAAISNTAATSPRPASITPAGSWSRRPGDYRHAPRRTVSGPQPDARAWQAQIRLHHCYHHLAEHGKRPTIANITIARELTGLLWAAMTRQPDRKEELAA
jgi:transposase